MDEPRFQATINIPGYLPTSDEDHTFDTMWQAWEWLRDERLRDLDDPMNDEDMDDDQCLDELEGLIEAPEIGTVYGPTPGYEGDHDLGLAYSVSAI